MLNMAEKPAEGKGWWIDICAGISPKDERSFQILVVLCLFKYQKEGILKVFIC
jgi:hypothetical protein